MGIYNRHIGPRFVRCACGLKGIRAERESVVPEASGVVLEIGIGPGLNLPFYDAAKVERVIGVDPHEDFLKLGDQQKLAGAIPVSILRAPAEAIPLPDATADTAVVTFTLCSVEDPGQALSEVKRVLKPGGRILFAEHGLSNDGPVARWQRRANPVWRALAVGCNLNRPVVKLLSAAGFIVEEVEEHYLPGLPKIIGFVSRGSARPVPDLIPLAAS